MATANKKVHTAFSFIEVASVILIIGIVIAGMMQFMQAAQKTKLASARLSTNRSAVSSTSDLKFWVETTLEKSIAASEAINGNSVSIWYNLAANANNKNVTQSSAGSRPLYITNAINGLPALRFDGTNDNMSFDGNFLVGTNYTIFIVEQRRASPGGYIIGGSNGATNSLLHLGYPIDTWVKFGQYNNDLVYTIASYSSPTPRVHTFRFSSVTGQGKSYWLNGGASPDATDTAQTTALISFIGSNIGNYNGFFNGDIGEIIMFTRALDTDERQDVEKYLSKKWGIAIQ